MLLVALMFAWDRVLGAVPDELEFVFGLAGWVGSWFVASCSAEIEAESGAFFRDSSPCLVLQLRCQL